MSERRGSVPVGEEAVLVEGSAARERLLALAAGEPRERRRAILLDPGLAAAGRTDAEFSDQDVSDVKAGVLNTLRLRRVESPKSASHALPGLAAALAMLLLFLLPAGVERTPDAVSSVPPAAVPSATAITHPVVEAIGLPGARVYELAEEGFSVVLIVDESFEL